jgi:hypothetical protein
MCEESASLKTNSSYPRGLVAGAGRASEAGRGDHPYVAGYELHGDLLDRSCLNFNSFCKTTSVCAIGLKCQKARYRIARPDSSQAGSRIRFGLADLGYAQSEKPRR